MRKILYTEDMICFLSSNLAKYTRVELTKIFNQHFLCDKSVAAIKLFCRRNEQCSKNRIGRQQIYSKEMIEFLSANVNNYSWAELTQRFNQKFDSNKTENTLKAYIFSRKDYFKNMVRKLELPYTDAMIRFLSFNMAEYNWVELTKIFNQHFQCDKSVDTIKHFCCKNEECLKYRIRRQQLYTKEMIDFLRANFEGADYAELTRLFNSKFSLKKTISSISNCCLKNGMKKRVALPKSMVDFLRANFKDFTHEELTKRFNNEFNLEKTVYSIESYCSKYGLKKKDTSSQPVGTEKVWSRNTKSKRGCIFVKVDQAKWKAKHLKWKAKHHLLWEERNGPVPEGHRIIFADGSMDNFSIENLVLVTDSEYFFLLTRRLMNVDEELTKTGINVAKIRERIAEYNKKKCAQESACEQQSNRRTDHERQQKT